MRRLIIASSLLLSLAGSAYAQMAPENSGVNELNAQGTIGSAPCYGCSTPAPPSDCVANDRREACRGNGPYDERPWGSAHPGANGLNWQPKNGHDGGG